MMPDLPLGVDHGRLGLKAQATYRHPSRGEDPERKPKDTFRHPLRGGDNHTASR